MKLSELIYAFDIKYLLECAKSNLKPIDLTSKHKALIISEVASDIQKRMGVLELSLPKTSVKDTYVYALTSSVMDIQLVTYNGLPLIKTTVDKITERIELDSEYQTSNASGTPAEYAIDYASAIPNLYLYPCPSTNGDSIVIRFNPNLNLYSPSGATSQDFGSFNGTIFSGDTIFPSQYDQALILGMLAQVLPELDQKYNDHIRMLMNKQYNGEKFEYHYD